MLEDKDRIFTNLYGLHDWRLEAARKRGAWNGTADLIRMGHDWIIQQVKDSGLRGRGGAGFPTGLKWTFLPKVEDINNPGPRYLAINADESEPGTCKDREIMRHDPHLLIEGCMVASRAMRAHKCYVYLRGEYIAEREALEKAVKEAYEAKLIGKDNVNGWDFDLYVHHGAGAYICGEETSLLNSLEGRHPYPRNRPPYPVTNGFEDLPIDRHRQPSPTKKAGGMRLRSMSDHPCGGVNLPAWTEHSRIPSYDSSSPRASSR